jgi:hypothetical protein
MLALTKVLTVPSAGGGDVANDIEAAAGAGTRLVRNESLERFDVLPLLVATDAGDDNGADFNSRRREPAQLAVDAVQLREQRSRRLDRRRRLGWLSGSLDEIDVVDPDVGRQWTPGRLVDGAFAGRRRCVRAAKMNPTRLPCI